MSLLNSTSKIVILAKRSSSWTDDKTGKQLSRQYVSGFDPESESALFIDVPLAEDGFTFNQVKPNTIYEGEFIRQADRMNANSSKLTGVRLQKVWGVLEAKQSAK